MTSPIYTTALCHKKHYKKLGSSHQETAPLNRLAYAA